MNFKDIPVLVLGYKRYEQINDLLNILDRWEIKNIFIAIDGYKSDEDRLSVQQARSVARSFSNKRSGVKLHLQDANIGCRLGVPKAISWFFNQVEMGVILEEDVRIDRSFMEACAVLLPKYSNETSIMHINASSFGLNKAGDNFRASRYMHPWGWATWSRAWNCYSDDMTFWKKNNFIRQVKTLKKIGLSNLTTLFFLFAFRLTAQEKNSSWAFRWNWSVWNQGGYSFIPPVNLSSNIGCNYQGTHTQDQRHFDHYPIQSIGHIKSNLVDNISKVDDEKAFRFTNESNKKTKLFRMFVSTLVSRKTFLKIRGLIRG